MKNNVILKIFSPLFVLLFQSLILIAQKDLTAFEIYNSKGKKVKYEELLKESLKSDVVFFGELHNQPICHWIEYELLKSIYQNKKEKLVVGAEMFEADDQIILNEYLNGFIDLKKFDAEAKLWKNYSTDYAPLVDFAKEKKIPFVASNIPTRYANMVYKNGLEILEKIDTEALKWISPLPFEVDAELQSYKNMVIPGHGNNLMLAQAIKDATMAHFIEKNLVKDGLFLHFNGAYHSDLKEGIIWFLNKKQPNLNILNISSVEVEDFENIDKENFRKADYIIVINSKITKSY
jgi:uncharacterized iron-regulated protein